MKTLQASVCAVSLLLQLPAVAGPPAPQPSTSPVVPTLTRAPTAAMTKKARDLYAEGIRAYEQSRFSDAHAAVLAAWALEKHYSIACNLGDVEMRLSMARDAAEHLSICVREMGKDEKSTSDERKHVGGLLAQAKKLVFTVVLRSNVAGAELLVDGVRVGAGPFVDPIFLDGATHTMEVRADGYLAHQQEIKGAVGKTTEIAVELKKPPSPVPAATSTTPPPPPPMPSKVPAFVLGSVAVAGAAVGAGLLVAASSELGAAEDKYRGVPNTAGRCVERQLLCTEIADAVRRGDTFGNVGVGVLVGAGAAAASAVGYWLLTQRAPQRPVVQAAPIVGAGVGGVIVRGAW